MAQAKRVYTTPRRTASKIKAKQAANQEQRDLHHGQAFRDLESSVHHLYCAAEIAAEIATGGHEDQAELAHFAIYQLCEMVRALRAKYRADLHAGKVVQS